MFLFFLLLLPSPIITCHLRVLDHENPDDYCHRHLPPGSLCLLRPEWVHPTQSFIGHVEASCTRSLIERQSSADLKQYLMNNVVPLIIGPTTLPTTTFPTSTFFQSTPGYYIVDHHHLAYALYMAHLDFKRPQVHRLLYACVQFNYVNLSASHFWQQMNNQHLVFLENERGQSISIKDLPQNVKMLTDNPYRTFASWLRQSHGYLKTDDSSVYFLECQWADYLRVRYPLETYLMLPEQQMIHDFIYRAAPQLQIQALQSILQSAVAYAVSNRSVHMPGYNDQQTKYVPKPIKLDSYGCPL